MDYVYGNIVWVYLEGILFCLNLREKEKLYFSIEYGYFYGSTSMGLFFFGLWGGGLSDLARVPALHTSALFHTSTDLKIQLINLIWGKRLRYQRILGGLWDNIVFSVHHNLHDNKLKTWIKILNYNIQTYRTL